MKELKDCCLHHVAGGAVASNGVYYCPDCGETEADALSNFSTGNFSAGNFTAAGSVIGSFYGPVGNLVGAGIGYIMDNTNYYSLGEAYKNRIQSELKQGYIPAD